MIKTRLKYCVYDPDPRGNDRYYVRRPGHKKIRIKERFEDGQGNITEAFMKAYFAALASMTETAVVKKERPREDTFEWLVNRYYRSAAFLKLGKTTQREKRSILDRYCETAGKRPFRAMKKEDVEKSQAKRAGTPGAADNLVKVLRTLFNWAISEKLMTHNPAVAISKINKSEGFHTWTEAEVEQYRRTHALGTMARLALEIMVNIGARISDAALLGPPHDIGGVLSFIQQKNRHRKPKRVEVKMFSALSDALAVTKTGAFTYLLTEYGQPFTKAGLGNKMRDWCEAAGLPHCSSHGLRKRAAVEHAEGGSSAMEMCAVFGWDKLETAETYIRAAQQRAMSNNAISRIEEQRRLKNVSLSGVSDRTETKNGKSDGKST